MNIQVDPLIQQNHRWAEKVRQANETLKVELGKYVSQATGRWTLEMDEAGRPQLVLELTDSDGTALGRFSEEDFASTENLGWRLHHLWTEVLLDTLHKGVKHMERFYQDEAVTHHA